MNLYEFHIKVCQSKRRYRTKTLAKASARKIKLKTAEVIDGRKVYRNLKPYKCIVCSKWHLYTKIPKNSE